MSSASSSMWGWLVLESAFDIVQLLGGELALVASALFRAKVSAQLADREHGGAVVLRLLLIWIIFACKQQPSGDPDPCAQYPDSRCPGQHHPAHDDDDKNKRGKESEQRESEQHAQQDGSGAGEASQRISDEGDGGASTAEESAGDADGEGGDADSRGGTAEERQEVELSALKVYAYLSREQVEESAAGAPTEKKPHSNEQGYVVGFYFSVWSQLAEAVRKQIVSTLAIKYGHFSWDVEKAQLSLPTKLVFSAEDKQHCWQVTLGTEAFQQALHTSDFTSASRLNRTSLRNLQVVQNRMSAMQHSIGDCQ